jgi:hypothetical protein
MGPELSRKYVKLVRDEAEAKHRLQNRRDAILRLAKTAAMESPDPTEPHSEDSNELLRLLKEDMAGMFELLLTAPQNDNFKAKASPEKVGFNRYRHITVEGYGYMEVQSIGDPTALKEKRTLSYRVAVVGLPAAFSSSNSLDNSPVIAELVDWDLVPIYSVHTNIDKLKDQRGTLKAVCEAAGLIEQDQIG